MRKKLIIIFSVLSIVIILFLLYATRPFIIYVYSDTIPEQIEKRLDKPKHLSLYYRTFYIKESEFDQKIGNYNPRLVILDPLSDVQCDYKCARYLRNDESADINFIIDDRNMWRSFLSLDSVAFLYEELDADAIDIYSEVPESESIISIHYSGRISGVNVDDIVNELESNNIKNVILFDAESSYGLIEYDQFTFYVDFLDEAALGEKNVKTVKINWNKAIKEALDLERGNISLDFALV